MSEVQEVGAFKPGRGARQGARLLLAPVLLAVALGVAACGSGALSHHQLVSQANRICHQATTSAAQLGSPGSGYAGLAHYAQQLSPIVQTMIGRLNHLHAGAVDQPKLNRYVSALRTGNRGLGMLAAATDSAQATQASSLITSLSVPNLASDLGASGCAASPSP